MARWRSIVANSDKLAIEAQTQALRAARHWLISVFAEPPFSGNAAMVYLLEQPALYTAMSAAARQNAASASCFLWPGIGNAFHIRCFNDSGLIQCCGHGVLAAAYVLHHVVERVISEPLQLYLSDKELLTVVEHSGKLWLRLPRLHAEASAIPDWTKMAFAPLPIRAAIAGGEQGYWVLEYSSDVHLADVMVDHEVICQNTQRAVIITQINSGSRDNPHDFYLRYFAPQYGVDEDSVTGSAQRVLADYWGRKTGASRFTVLQCSTGGGVISVELQSEHVAINGHLRML